MEQERQVEQGNTRGNIRLLWGVAFGLLPALLLIGVAATTKPCQPTSLLTTILSNTTIVVFCAELLLACIALFRKPLRRFGVSLLVTLLITCSLFLLCTLSGAIIAFVGLCIRFT
jgi:hypothetical protein